MKLLYGGDINKVDAGIGIRVEPKPPGNGLGWLQNIQFVLNAPRRVKSNRFLSEGYNYQVYKEGMNWIEHGHGVQGMIRRHQPKLGEHLEGVVRVFAPWEKAEEFPRRMFDQTHADTGMVAIADARTFAIGCVVLTLGACAGVLASSTASLVALALFIAPMAQAWLRMLAMRDEREVWKVCNTDKRDTLFGTLYRAERWINRAAVLGGVQALAVIIGFQVLAWSALQSHHPIVAVLAALASLSGAPTWTGSVNFAKHAQLLKVALRNRMRSKRPAKPAADFQISHAKFWLSLGTPEEFERMFKMYAPGRDYITAYDFARMHEGNRVSKKRGLLLSFFLLPVLPFEIAAQLLATLRTDRLVREHADLVVAEDNQLVSAITRETLLRVCEGSAHLQIMQEKEEGNHDPSPTIIRQ